MPALTFNRLRIAAWRQFASVDVNFHRRLTILTGANGAGKSTLLNVLSKHLGAERPYISVYRADSTGAFRFFSGIYEMKASFLKYISNLTQDKNQIGQITYSDGSEAKIKAPDGQQNYNLSVDGQKEVPGFHVPSHRSLPVYQQIPYIAFGGINPEHAHGPLTNEMNARHLGQHSGSSTIFHIKNLIVAWLATGDGNRAIPKDLKQLNAYNGLIDVLRKVLPESFGFVDIEVRPPEVILLTKTGEFLVDASSGGLSALIEIAAIIYTYSLKKEIVDGSFVVTIDEPENHLHPTLQRSLLPNLVKAFPNVQFIVATHSPFIVSSVKDSNVYVLRYEDSGSSGEKITDSRRVVSRLLDYQNRAGNASEILREVLGVPATLPIWVEEQLEAIVRKYDKRELNQASIADIKAELKVAGLSELFPDALVSLGRGR